MRVVRCEDGDVEDSLLEASAGERESEGHDAAGERGKHQKVGHMRHARDAADREHELDIAGTHAAGEIEDKEDDPAEEATGERTEQLTPSTEGEVQRSSRTVSSATTRSLSALMNSIPSNSAKGSFSALSRSSGSIP